MSKYQEHVLKDEKYRRSKSNRSTKRNLSDQSSETLKKELLSVQHFEMNRKKRVFECFKNILKVNKLEKSELLYFYFQRLLGYFRNYKNRYHQYEVRSTVIFLIVVNVVVICVITTIIAY